MVKKRKQIDKMNSNFHKIYFEYLLKTKKKDFLCFFVFDQK
jgi:hypothetical protein